MVFENATARTNRDVEPEAWKGNPKAQFALGLMYQKGKGVCKDYKQAYVWYSKAADNGNKGAVKNREDLVRIMTPKQREDAKAPVLSVADP
jgi:TPR repeat protein